MKRPHTASMSEKVQKQQNQNSIPESRCDSLPQLALADVLESSLMQGDYPVVNDESLREQYAPQPEAFVDLEHSVIGNAAGSPGMFGSGNVVAARSGSVCPSQVLHHHYGGASPQNQALQSSAVIQSSKAMVMMNPAAGTVYPAYREEAGSSTAFSGDYSRFSSPAHLLPRHHLAQSPGGVQHQHLQQRLSRHVPAPNTAPQYHMQADNRLVHHSPLSLEQQYYSKAITATSHHTANVSSSLDVEYTSPQHHSPQNSASTISFGHFAAASRLQESVAQGQSQVSFTTLMQTSTTDSKPAVNGVGDHATNNAVFPAEWKELTYPQPNPCSVASLSDLSRIIQHDVAFNRSSLLSSDCSRTRQTRSYRLPIPAQTDGSSFQSNLRSPALHNPSNSGDRTPPPYTAPPILPPSRLGSGLYWSLLSENALHSENSELSQMELRQRCNDTTEEARSYCMELPPETDVKPHLNVGPRHQAVLPECLSYHSRDSVSSTHNADPIWHPSVLDNVEQRELDMYLEFAYCASAPGGGRNKEYALILLYMTGGNIKDAMFRLMQPTTHLSSEHPLLDFATSETEDRWSAYEIQAFQHGLTKYDKEFGFISKEVGSKTCKQCVQFYYYWKRICTDEYNQLRRLRAQRLSQLPAQPPAQQLPVPGLTNIYHQHEQFHHQQQQQQQHQQQHHQQQQQLQQQQQQQQQHSASAASLTPLHSPSQHPHLHQHLYQNYDHFTGDVRPNYAQIGARIPQNYTSRPMNPAHMRLACQTERTRSPTPDKRSQIPVASPASSQGDSTEDFPCKLCGKVFHKVKSRNAHMKSHRPVDTESKRRGPPSRHGPHSPHSLSARRVAASRAAQLQPYTDTPHMPMSSPGYIIPNI